jgi:hypothetical protein
MAESSLVSREEAVLVRELEAEAGFASQRRASLDLLATEATTLRAELSSARAQIAADQADWDQRWRAEDSRVRERLAEEARAHEQDLQERSRIHAAELKAERESLAQERTDLRHKSERAANELDMAQEERTRIDTLVARRAGAALRQAHERAKDLDERLTSAQTRCDELHAVVMAHEEAKRRGGHRTPEELDGEITKLRGERDALSAELATRPSRDITQRLADLERAQENWEADRARLTQDCVAERSRAARAFIAVTELETLRDQKAGLESSRGLLRAALEELRRDVDERVRQAEGVSTFPACTAIDLREDLSTAVPVVDRIDDLAAFCSDLQQRIAGDRSSGATLRYALRDIRCFVAGLGMSRLHVLEGISGTGKTSLPLAIARALGGEATLVEVQSGWRDRQDLIGHYNAFDRRFHETEFLQALYRAGTPRNSDLVQLVVLDEMNLSHPEQYFADLLSALEQEPARQKLDLMTAPVSPAPALLRDGRTLKLPPNVWFVGTANHDETTKELADKTYDRAHVMELPRNRTSFEISNPPPRAPISVKALRESFSRAERAHAQEASSACRFLDDELAEMLGRRFGIGWGNRLERQVRAFVPVVVAAGGSLGEGLDHLIASKVLRKVKDRHDTRPEDLTALREKLLGAWSKLGCGDSPERSRSILDEELRRLGAEDEA